MIETEAIRKKVLDLALRGKLTEQLPEDGDAEELYLKIQEEKKRLENEGKIKRINKLPEITSDEIPFEIPKNWKWVHLGEIFQHNSGKALNTSDNDGELLEYITTSNMYWDHFELDDLKQMHFKPEEIDKCTIKKGDLLICEGGDIGRSAIWNYDFDMRIQNHIHKLRAYLPNTLIVKFYYYVMWLYKHTGLINGRGIGLQGFSSKRVDTLVVPFLSIEEQERIVEKVDSIFTLLDKIDELQADYEKNKEVLKSKLIDAAISGHLSKQLSEDGTAEELLEKIQEEKSHLEKEGKLKKSKKLPEITPEEIPFEIPASWRWVCIASISKVISKGTTPRGGNVSYCSNGVGFLRAENLCGYDKITKENLKFVDEETHLNFLKRSILQDNDVLISIAGTLGKTGLVRKQDLPLNANQAIAFIRLIDTTNVNPLYVVYALNAASIKKMLLAKKVEMAIPNLSLEVIGNCPMPLPPLAEQNRIVETLDNLLSNLS